MHSIPHIVIVGLGGVGGYYGGLWTRLAMAQPDRLRVSYLMRPGAHYEQVKHEGLHISSPSLGSIQVRPSLVTCTPGELGRIDYLILVTKSYDLESSLQPLLPYLTSETNVLPLLNGLDLHETLEQLLPPHVQRWGGIAYITARREAPGQIVSHSEQDRLFGGSLMRPIGSERTAAEQWLEEVSHAAGIDLVIPDDPMAEVRRKYLMLSNSAAATGYFDCNVSGLLGEHRDFLEGLTHELLTLYATRGWTLEGEDVDTVLKRIARMPEGTTTSMNSDLRAQHQSEVESLVGYVVRASHAAGLPAPCYEEAYTGILARIDSFS